VSKVLMDFEKCCHWMHFVWKQWKTIQFGPHRLLFSWMCEEFWKCGFSIEWCLL